MALVKVKFSGSAHEFGARIDDVVLTLNAQGEGEKDVVSGVHFLTFFAIAPPGTKCKIEITAPLKWEREIPIPANGINGGFKKFMI